jgi:Bacterial archaeo-eukaryotic release factor family 3
MNNLLTPEMREIVEATGYRPVVSIILPFEPKMGLRTEVSYELKTAVDQVEKEIKKNYPSDAGNMVIDKLRTLLPGLNYNTHKKSIAIYVSPLFEKVIYLDFPVEKRISVGTSFNIRELVYAKKQVHEYLVLLLSFNGWQVFLGNTSSVARIVSNDRKSAISFDNDPAEKISNFTDLTERKEVLMDKFLHHIDNELDFLLKLYRLPLFVVGTRRIMGHFRKLTRHASSIISYIHGNYDHADPAELNQVLEPHIHDWETVAKTNLKKRLDDAYGRNKLAVGIKDVWKEAMNNKGQLLVVEKNFTHPAIQGSKKEDIRDAIGKYDKNFFIPDAVEKIIEQVLEHGGDVEFGDAGMLKDYDRIALELFY